jgi:hypothetical protein
MIKKTALALFLSPLLVAEATAADPAVAAPACATAAQVAAVSAALAGKDRVRFMAWRLP